MMRSELKKKPIAIVGAGMVGLLLARLLAKAKINTVIVEAKKTVITLE